MSGAHRPRAIPAPLGQAVAVTCKTLTLAALLLATTMALAQTQTDGAGHCGEVVTVGTHGRTTTRYALAYPQPEPAPAGRVALVLLVGGGGHLDLDDRGCARALSGNSLVRSLSHFHGEGFITALVDAPSDHAGGDGLAGFRVTASHSADLAQLIADLRRRTGAAVWLVGTSRGSISAVNAASQLAGPAAIDGLVLTSALMSGHNGGRKSWLAQTVFDLPLEAIRVPVLVVGHEGDGCPRSPPRLMGQITARTNAEREQVVTVTGGSIRTGPGVDACEGRAPHGFVDQEAEVVAGIARFIRGGMY